MGFRTNILESGKPELVKLSWEQIRERNLTLWISCIIWNLPWGSHLGRGWNRWVGLKYRWQKTNNIATSNLYLIVSVSMFLDCGELFLRSFLPFKKYFKLILLSSNENNSVICFDTLGKVALQMQRFLLSWAMIRLNSLNCMNFLIFCWIPRILLAHTSVFPFELMDF